MLSTLRNNHGDIVTFRQIQNYILSRLLYHLNSLDPEKKQIQNYTLSRLLYHLNSLDPENLCLSTLLYMPQSLYFYDCNICVYHIQVGFIVYNSNLYINFELFLFLFVNFEFDYFYRNNINRSKQTKA